MESQAPLPRIQPTQLSKYSKRVILKTILGRADGGSALIGQKTIVGGWVKSAREIRKGPPPPLPVPQTAEKPAPPAKSANLTCADILQIPLPVFRNFLKAFGVGGGNLGKLEGPEKPAPPVPSTVFLQLSDGSCVDSLQVVVDSSLASPSQIMHTGTCILVEGVIQKPSSSAAAGTGKHAIELVAESILHLGTVDHGRYPLSKKRVPLDALRDWAHIRPRTTTVATITRVSNSLTHGVHTFFQNNAFLHVQVPIITATDTEGFGDKFLVKTTNPAAAADDDHDDHASRGVNLETVKASIKEKSNRVEELKRTDSNREALATAMQDLSMTNQLASQLERKEKASKTGGAKAEKRAHFQGDDEFFSCQAYLTVSGRLHLASYCCALGNVYSFGPRFKAEKTKPTRQLAEMWKVEAEMAFTELEEAMNCSVDLLKFLSKWVLENCPEDMRFLLKRADKTIADRLESLIAADFDKISYTDAVDALRKEKKFESHVAWGDPLTDEHESYLVDHIYKRPIIVYGYPKEIKPFHVRVNDDGKTVASFDVLVPKAGALIRGSQSEERINMLSSRIKDLGLPSEQYEWYMDLLRHGSVKHAGFSLVFDHMVLLATGITDAQNVNPFPRSYGKLNH